MGARGEEKAAMTGLRVLPVEDDALLGLAAEDVLRGAGHAVAPARDGAEALALACGGPPFDVLVTDLSVPRLDGASLVRPLTEERTSLPVVAVTGYALSSEDRSVLDGDGPTVVLTKPRTPEEIAVPSCGSPWPGGPERRGRAVGG
jgi:CheY-like chemotaxis protein